MLEFRKIRNYEVTVEDGKVINIVKPDQTTGYVYKYDDKQRASVRQDNLTFEQLRSGIYDGRYEIYWKRYLMEKKLKKVYQNTDAKVLGKKFFRLTPIKRINFKEGYSRYLCKCDCGNEIEVLGSQLLAGYYKSCGCYHKEGYKHFKDIKDLGTKKLQSKRVEGTSLYGMTMKTPVTNTSGVKGVSYVKKRKKYRAYIYIRGKQKNLGEYKTLEEAAKAREEAEKSTLNLS